MLAIAQIKGILFDYGATIDTNGKHWFEVLWDAYVACGLNIDKQTFRDAYVYGERYLSDNNVIMADFTFKDVLLTKTEIQLKWLAEKKKLHFKNIIKDYSLAISNQCYTFVTAKLKETKPVLERLSSRYPLVLVTNFYGNIETVLKDFGLDAVFCEIIESAVVGIRKPDSALFLLGVNKLALKPEEVLVVGDSCEKDITPAKSIGCQTIWLRGSGWKSETNEADAIIHNLEELDKILMI
jgi:putative hydrolase of the HAD superfamily